MRSVSLVVAVFLWFPPTSIFCGVAGVVLSNRAREAAQVGDSPTASLLLDRARTLLILAIVVFVIWWVAFTAYFVFQGPTPL
jgi:hypothetical protein